MDPIEEKLAELGLTLPEALVPSASYIPFRFNGNTLMLAGVISIRDGKLTHAGQVGRDQTVETGYAAAQMCALNALASMKAALGRLDRVRSIFFVFGYVNAVAGFDLSHAVINGASDLFVKLYGERGRHARAAVAVAGLPLNATAEIQVTVLFE
jgi:enamine deaminase RidA (YjgF/YER057c/UK114 family)